MYDLPKKMKDESIRDLHSNVLGYVPIKPSRELVRAKARVISSFSEKVMQELAETTGHVLDPELVKLSWKKARDVKYFLTTKMEIFLLALCLEAPERPNIDYIQQLDEYYRKSVSSGFISNWSKKRFLFRGSFGRPTLSPWISSRKGKFFSSCNTKKMDLLFDHTKWNFLDKKTINKDVLPMKGRANPLTGYINFTPVTGDF
jgi:hypothetical protein